MHEVQRASALASAALCAAVAGCASAPNFAAQNACSELRKGSADYRDNKINIATYVGLMQTVARDAQDATDRDMIAAGASLEAAVSVGIGSIMPLGDLTTMTRAADKVGDVCDGLGL